MIQLTRREWCALQRARAAPHHCVGAVCAATIASRSCAWRETRVSTHTQRATSTQRAWRTRCSTIAPVLLSRNRLMQPCAAQNEDGASAPATAQPGKQASKQARLTTGTHQRAGDALHASGHVREHGRRGAGAADVVCARALQPSGVLLVAVAARAHAGRPARQRPHVQRRGHAARGQRHG